MRKRRSQLAFWIGIVCLIGFTSRISAFDEIYEYTEQETACPQLHQEFEDEVDEDLNIEVIEEETEESETVSTEEIFLEDFDVAEPDETVETEREEIESEETVSVETEYSSEIEEMKESKAENTVATICHTIQDIRIEDCETIFYADMDSRVTNGWKIHVTYQDGTKADIVLHGVKQEKLPDGTVIFVMLQKEEITYPVEGIISCGEYTINIVSEDGR